MTRHYYLGSNSDNEILIQVKVGTEGSASSVVQKYMKGGVKVDIVESDRNSGNIGASKIGIVSNLNNTLIVICTLINFSGIPDDKREDAVKNIFTSYKLSGGYMGEVKYKYDYDDITIAPDNKTVVITKAIRLIDTPKI